MNHQVEEFCRQRIKEGLSKLPEKYKVGFRLMYADRRGKTIEEVKSTQIDEVVTKMEANKLDWAMTQVENSIRKNEEEDVANADRKIQT